MIRDRAEVVADALVAELIDTLTTVARTELRRRIIGILREEFAEERAQGAADHKSYD